MQNNRHTWCLLFFLGLLLLLVLALPVTAAKHDLVGQAAPEFTQAATDDWLNSKPLKLADLAGNVVLLDFWTFGCWNCYNSFPWLNSLEEKYAGKPFKIVGVHSPEFEHEKNRDKLLKKITEFGLKHAIMVDNDFNYWRAMHNRYWPAFYIVDKQGVIRGFYAGETHSGDSQSRRIGNLIARLLKE